MIITFQKIIKFISTILWICCIIELLFFYSVPNAIGCLTFLYAWHLGKKIILTEGNFIHFPLITLSLFVLLLMYYVFPIFFTLLDGHAVTYRMENPLITFFYQSLYITSLVISFIIFRKIYNSNNWLNKLWLHIGIYKSPTIREAVILSAIGFFAFIYTLLTATNDESNYAGGFVSQLMQNLQSYAYIPICFLMAGLYFNESQRKKYRLYTLLYFSVIIIMAIATSRRSLMVMPIFMAFILMFLSLILYNKRYFITKKVFFITCLCLCILGPLQDMAKAMIYVRVAYRGVDTETLFKKIVDVYQDKNLLKAIDKSNTFNDAENYQSGWSETYISNEFMERYCNLKVIDMSIYYVEKLGYCNRQVTNYTKDYMLALLPTPVLQLLHIDLDKKQMGLSPGDYIYGLYTGNNYLGYFRVFSHVASGLAIFGLSFFLIMIPFYWIFWILINSMTPILKGKTFISFVAFLYIYKYAIFYINSGGFYTHLSFVFREFWQSIIIYVLLMFLIRKVLKLSK